MGKLCSHFLRKQGPVALVVLNWKKIFQRETHQNRSKSLPGREKSSSTLPSGLPVISYWGGGTPGGGVNRIKQGLDPTHLFAMLA